MKSGSSPTTSRIAASSPSPLRFGRFFARFSSSGVWFHISLPPHTPFGVLPTVRM